MNRMHIDLNGGLLSLLATPEQENLEAYREA